MNALLSYIRAYITMYSLVSVEEAKALEEENETTQLPNFAKDVLQVSHRIMFAAWAWLSFVASWSKMLGGKAKAVVALGSLSLPIYIQPL